MMQIIKFQGDNKNAYRDLLETKDGILIDGIFINRKFLISCEQVQGSDVAEVVFADAGAGFSAEKDQIKAVDALVSNAKNVFLMVRTADCTPVLLFDQKKHCFAAIHSGREGTRGNIVGKSIALMIKLYNSDPVDLTASIGPSICVEHYEVDALTYARFVEDTKIPQKPNYLDIRKVVKSQLMTAGVLENNIDSIDQCTYENNYFSYRKDKTRNRQISIIGIYDGTIDISK